jgi:hypothetical protein
MYISQQFSRGGDMDRADRLLVMCALFLTDVRCNASAKQFFWEQIEKVRQESKAQIREQTGQLSQLFGPRQTKTTAPTTPVRRGRGRPRKNKTPPVSLDPLSQLKGMFKQPPMSPGCQRLLAPLFRPAPTPPVSSSTGKQADDKEKHREQMRQQEQMRAQLQGLFTKRGSR